MHRKKSHPAWPAVAVLQIARLALLLAPAAAVAERPAWDLVAAVDAVEIRIHWVSEPELRAAARRFGKRPSTEALGFSVLQREGEAGRYVCDLYLIEKPKRVDDGATLSLGHEASHCFGFSHR